jgi:hypothetical protein
MMRNYGKTRNCGHPQVFFILLAMIFIAGSGCNSSNLDLKDVVGIMTKKLDLVSRMRINLLKSVEAEKSAVMADTDESSQALADEAKKTTEALEKDRQDLDLLIKQDPSDQEIKLLQEFDRSWSEFRKTDQVLLEFAVKNTNLKAAQLSFIKGSEAEKAFEESLKQLVAGKPLYKDDYEIADLVFKAVVAGLKIHYLHAPHIAAANDGQMDNIEADIKRNEAVIKQALKELKPLVPHLGQPSLQKAEAAYDQLVKVTKRVIDLSRQNTNIKSFELSLGRKRKVTAQCDEILLSLQEAVRNRSFKATR